MKTKGTERNGKQNTKESCVNGWPNRKGKGSEKVDIATKDRKLWEAVIVYVLKRH